MLELRSSLPLDGLIRVDIMTRRMAKRDFTPSLTLPPQRGRENKSLPPRRGKVRMGVNVALTLCMTFALFLWGCAFPPPVQTTIPALLSNPREYAHQRVEVSGTVEWGGMRHPDFEYWHFHLKRDGEEIVCYSEAYKYQVWTAIDRLIRRAAAAGKEVTVGGYLVRWGAGRSVIRAKWITYEGRTYDAEFIPPAVSPALFSPGVGVPSF